MLLNNFHTFQLRLSARLTFQVLVERANLIEVGRMEVFRKLELNFGGLIIYYYDGPGVLKNSNMMLGSRCCIILVKLLPR